MRFGLRSGILSSTHAILSSHEHYINPPRHDVILTPPPTSSLLYPDPGPETALSEVELVLLLLPLAELRRLLLALHQRHLLVTLRPLPLPLQTTGLHLTTRENTFFLPDGTGKQRAFT